LPGYYLYIFWLDYTGIRAVYYDGEVTLETGNGKQITRGKSRLQLIHYPGVEEPDANASAFFIL